MKPSRLTATKRERLKRERIARMEKRMRNPAVKAKMLAMAERYFAEKFDKVWPHIAKESRMDRGGAWLAFLAGVVAARAYEQDPPKDVARLGREIARR